MAAVGVLALYERHIKPWMYSWGATDSEIAARLPGDEFVSADAVRTTRAVTINASVAAVWPWLLQIGEDRGGFYSYAWLERAAGADVHNATTVHPEWQDLQVGDTVWLAQRYGEVARLVVAAIKPRSHLILMSPEDFDRVRRGERASGLWAFYVRRTGSQTRLLVRGVGGFAGHAGFDIPHFVMEQRMLRGIRDRAEKTPRTIGAPAGQTGFFARTGETAGTPA